VQITKVCPVRALGKANAAAKPKVQGLTFMWLLQDSPIL